MVTSDTSQDTTPPRRIPIIHARMSFGFATTWGDMRAMVDAANSYQDDDLVEVTWNPYDPNDLDAIVIRSTGPTEG